MKLARTISIVSHVTGVSERRICSAKRDKGTRNARNIVYYVGYWHEGMTLKEIGQELDRDHTTVINGRDRVERCIDEHEGFANLIDRIVYRVKHPMSDDNYWASSALPPFSERIVA